MNLRVSIIVICISMLAFVVPSWAQSQPEINERTGKEYEAADLQMNKLYKQIVTKHKGETLFLQKLEKSQKAWVVYRDAQMAASFPIKGDPHVNYGSSYSMDYALEMTALTKARIKRLSEWAI
jgi:uncharacterized protein YecT (DUF1311 family)